jgi:hypothetical protein
MPLQYGFVLFAMKSRHYIPRRSTGCSIISEMRYVVNIIESVHILICLPDTNKWTLNLLMQLQRR